MRYLAAIEPPTTLLSEKEIGTPVLAVWYSVCHGAGSARALMLDTVLVGAD
jgi:hypothetical protein